jgi:sulfide:quinone oxidoreductase
VGIRLFSHPPRVLIAGGGVAGLEATLALRHLAPDRMSVTLLAPEPEFVYRPMRVREPFGLSEARRYSIEEFAGETGAELVRDGFKWLDHAGRTVHTEGGRELSYDVLLLAMGARLSPRFKHALTLDDRRLDEQLHGLIQDVEGGYTRSIAFLIPYPMPWPLPVYELALMLADRAADMNVDLSVTVVTPEEAPLAVFGEAVSDGVRAVLESKGILAITSAQAEVPEPGRVEVHPGGRRLDVDRIVAAPELSGPATPGLPSAAQNGFIPVDAHCKVKDLDDVYAAGDATDFPLKFGGIAAQQADAAASAIAARAGADVEPKPFDPTVHAILLGGDKPLYLSAQIVGGRGSSSELSETPSWSPVGKIAAHYLAPYLDARDRAASGAG